MDSIFKSLFGFPNYRNPYTRRHDDENFISPLPPEEHQDDDQLGINTFLFTHPNDMFRQLDEMFANFEGVFRGLGVLEPPSFEFVPGDSSPDSVEPFEYSPRDKMLKMPDPVEPYQSQVEKKDHINPGHPSLFGRLWSRRPGRLELPKEDCDLDASVRSGGLDKLFSDGYGSELAVPLPHRSSVFKSVTVRTNRSVDGKVEETRTIVDGEGNQHTIVTRTVDGQTVRQTTRKNKTGDTEVVEDLINMDEKDKTKFEERWRAKTTLNQPWQSSAFPSPRDDALRELDSDKSNISIFSRLFGLDSSGFRPN